MFFKKKKDLSDRDEFIFFRAGLNLTDKIPETGPNKRLGVEKWTNGVKTYCYEWALFIPQVFIEQCTIVTNAFFILMGVIQLIQVVSDSGGVPTTWLPVFFIIFISMGKEAVEEVKRHRTDRIQNSQMALVLDSTGQFVQKKWKDVMLGDIVKVCTDQPACADLLVLRTSEEFDVCFVDTKEMDGEANLKQKMAPYECGGLLGSESDIARTLGDSHFTMMIAQPSKNIYKFSGYLVHHEHTNGEEIPPMEDIDQFSKVVLSKGSTRIVLGYDNFIWRGSIIRCTDWAICMVLYPGHMSRIFLNSRDRPKKRTLLMEAVRTHIMWCAIMEFILCIAMSVMTATTTDDLKYHWYLRSESDAGTQGFNYEDIEPTTVVQVLYSFLISFGRLILLLSYVVPITLLVQLEFAHWVNALMIYKDKKMVKHMQVEDPYTGNMTSISIAPVVNTVDVIDDLGSITHIFSDKTGTLTQNIMQFKAFSVGDVLYREPATKISNRHVDLNIKRIWSKNNRAISETADPNRARSELKSLLLCISLCHDVKIKRRLKGIEYFDPIMPDGDVMDLEPSIDESDSESQSSISELRNILDVRPDPREPSYTASNITARSAITNNDGTKSYSTSSSSSSMSLQIEADRPNTSRTTIDRVELQRLISIRREFEKDYREAEIPSDSSRPQRTERALNTFRDVTYHQKTPYTLSSRTSIDRKMTMQYDMAKKRNDAALHSAMYEGWRVIKYPRERLSTITYEASSPDELALLCGMKEMGIEYVDSPTPNTKCLCFSNKNAYLLFKDDRIHREYSAVVSSQEFTPYNLKNMVEVENDPEREIVLPSYTVKVLEVLEFESNRKRMSVIVEMNDLVHVYTKGADSQMVIISDDSERSKQIESHVHQLSCTGLRTLVFGERILTKEEYVPLQDIIARAKAANDEEALQDAIANVEKNMTLLGCSGVDDLLQENVTDTLEALKDAGIKVWVLTGDKIETAIAIGHSAKLLDDDCFNVILKSSRKNVIRTTLYKTISYFIMGHIAKGLKFKNPTKRAELLNLQDIVDLFKFTSDKTETGAQDYEDVNALVQEYISVFEVKPKLRHTCIRRNAKSAESQESDSQNYLFKQGLNAAPNNQDVLDEAINDGAEMAQYQGLSMTITHEALSVCLGDSALCKLFFAVANLCNVIIACRVTPMEKALVVSSAKQYLSGLDGKSFCSLAIGDGANDVNMILTANIGIGLKGLEGQQASQCADISLGEFQVLRRLLFVHGHEALRRNGFMVYHTLYRNISFGTCAFWFAFHSMYSAVDVFNSWIKQGYNLVFTSMPIMAYAWFDRFLPHHFMTGVPQIYPIKRRPDGYMYYGYKWFWWWTMMGVVVSAVAVNVPLYVFTSDVNHTTHTVISFDEYGQMVFMVMVLVGCVSVSPFVSLWTCFLVWSVVLSIAVFYASWAVFSVLPFSDIYGSFFNLNQIREYHYTSTVVILLSTLPIVVWWLYRVVFRPGLQIVITERLRLGVSLDNIMEKTIKETNTVIIPVTDQKRCTFNKTSSGV